MSCHRWLAISVVATAIVAACSGCGSGAKAAARSTVDPVFATLQARLAALPTVDGAVLKTTDHHDGQLTETFAVPAGAPACRQILSRLDAAGYEVVTGATSDPVAADNCLTANAADAVSIEAGSGSVLAAGGSEVSLSWTAGSYTLTATT